MFCSLVIQILNFLLQSYWTLRKAKLQASHNLYQKKKKNAPKDIVKIVRKKHIV